MEDTTEGTEPTFADPDEFPSADDADETNVEIPDDSFDEGSVVDEEVNH